ncbi:hypothetical protein, partial [Massilia timonae]|uniref:hypothetical protein n=1 Tax=Massilia timonae TaxID=47229 RepID=UPI0028D271B7
RHRAIMMGLQMMPLTALTKSIIQCPCSVGDDAAAAPWWIRLEGFSLLRNYLSQRCHKIQQFMKNLHPKKIEWFYRRQARHAGH